MNAQRIDPRHEAKRVLLNQYHLKPGVRIFLIVKARRQFQMVFQPAVILYRMVDRYPVILTFGTLVNTLLGLEGAYQRSGIEGIRVEGLADHQIREARTIIEDLAYELFGDQQAFQIEWVDRGLS